MEVLEQPTARSTDPIMVSEVLGGSGPRARRTDPLTSHAAADGTGKSRPHSWLLIERALEQSAPMTAQELIRHIRTEMGVWISESRVTTAVSELREMGAIRQDGERRNPSGYAASAWRLTDET